MMENDLQRAVCEEKKSHDTYFYASSTSNKKILPVDIGDDSIVDINLCTDKKPSISTRKSNSPRKSKFLMFSPSLPLELPNQYKPIALQDLSECFFPKSFWVWKSKVHKQYGRLKKAHSRIFHQSLSNVHHCRKFISQVTNTTLPWSRMKISSTLDFVSDVPTDVLLPLLHESLSMQYDEIRENCNMKNCLAHYKTNKQTFVFCPVGELMDYVSAKEISFDCSQSGYCSGGFKMVKATEVVKIYIGHLVKEIFVTRDEMLHVRCDYHYHVYFISFVQGSYDLKLVRQYSFDELVHSIGVNYESSSEIYIVAEDESVSQFLGTPLPNKRASSADDVAKRVKWQTCIYGPSRETCLVLNESKLLMFDFRSENVIPCSYFDISSPYVNSKTEKLAPVLSWNPMNHHQYFLSTTQALLLNDERYRKTPVLQCNHYLKSPPYFLETLYDLRHDTESMLLCLGSYKAADSVLCQLFANGVRTISCGKTESLRCKQPVTVTQPLYVLAEYSDWCVYDVHWQLSLADVANRIHQPCIGFNLIPCTVLPSINERYINIVQQSLCGDLFFQQLLSTPCQSDEKEDNSFDSDIVEEEVLFKTVSLTEKSSDNDTVLISPARKRCNEWIDSIVHNVPRNKDIKGNDRKTFQNRMDTDNISGWQQIDNSKRVYSEELCTSASCFTDGFQYQRPHEVNATTQDTKNMYKALYDTHKATVCKLMNTQNTENNPCLCVKCSNEWYAKLSSVRSNCGILTRQVLNLPPIDDFPSEVLDVIDGVERSKKPLNRLLDTQWKEEKYVPLDTFAPNIAFIKYPDYPPSP